MNRESMESTMYNDSDLIQEMAEEFIRFWEADDIDYPNHTEDQWVYNAMGRHQGWYEECMSRYPNTDHHDIHAFWRECYHCYPRK